MAAEVAWSLPALTDVDEIAAYIARDSHRYASATVRKLLDAPKILELFPRGGRMIPERNDPKYRDLIVWPYRIVYRVDGDRVEVLAVIHGARLLEPAIGHRLVGDASSQQ